MVAPIIIRLILVTQHLPSVPRKAAHDHQVTWAGYNATTVTHGFTVIV